MGLRRYLPNMLAFSTVLAVGLIVGVPAVTGRQWPSWTGLNGKTVWDFAQLIIVPLSLALIAYLLSSKQRLEDREIARAQREQDLKIADERRRNDLQIAMNREREDALQAYLTAMTALLLDHDLKDQKVAVIAQARTITLLPRMDPSRKATVLRFLAGANLISAQHPVVSLGGADFSGMDGGPLSLMGVSLENANLSGSKLAYSSIRDSNLRYANLSGVDLSDADLVGSDFCASFLSNTDFSRSILVGADFSEGVPARASEREDLAKENERQAAESWLATLSEAKFTSAKWDYSTKRPPGFSLERAGAWDISD